MSKKHTVALVIATYNWSEALKLVLESLRNQTIMPDEIIIADDGSNELTNKLIEKYKPLFNIPLKHFWHHDNGFRKTIILNKALAGTDCEYIIQIDGDIVLDKNFVKDHINCAEKGFYIRGSRVMLTAKLTRQLLVQRNFKKIYPWSTGIKNRINATRTTLLSIFFTEKSRRSNNVSGCNCAYWREDFIKVNGYNNEIKGWGHEDIEFAARLVNQGVRQKKIKMRAVCYHLHHSYADRGLENINYKIYKETLELGLQSCIHGYHSCQREYQNHQHFYDFPAVGSK